MPQPIIIDLECGLPIDLACVTDRLEHTIDYAAVVERLRSIVLSHRCELAEAMAQPTARSRSSILPYAARRPLNGTTRCRCSPRPAMPSVTTSPAFSHCGAFMPSATPGGVPVVMMSPGSSVM